jgi:lysophospholipase L1-like esterase
MGKCRRMIGLAVVCLGVLVPAAAAGASQYVGLGDSYSSGVGTRVFYSESGSCKRSPEAYPPKVAAAKGYTLSFLACSGAKTTDLNANQLGTLGSTTALVTLTIGGNDAGFSNVIINCALYYFTCGSAINEANSFIANKLGPLLDTTYNNIRSRATTAHVVVIGYPHLFTSEGKTCNANFLTSSNEKKLNETGDKLDAKIKERVAAHGFTFVDSRNAFLPHAVCSSEEWLNGQSNPLEESYHPNVKGQKQFTTEVEAVLP